MCNSQDVHIYVYSISPLWKLAIPQKVWPKSIEKGERKSTGGCFLCLALLYLILPPTHSAVSGSGCPRGEGWWGGKANSRKRPPKLELACLPVGLYGMLGLLNIKKGIIEKAQRLIIKLNSMYEVLGDGGWCTRKVKRMGKLKLKRSSLNIIWAKSV